MILGSQGPLLYPSPPVPLSTSWRGGTQGQLFVPPLRIAERGTGGGVSSQVARLVGPRRARPALAPHARSLSRARVRVHAAADASESRGGVLSAVHRAVPRSRHAGAGAASSSEGSLGWAGILRASFESPRACARGQ